MSQCLIVWVQPKGRWLRFSRCKQPGQILHPTPATEQRDCPPPSPQAIQEGTYAAASTASTRKHYTFLKGARCEGLDIQRNCEWIWEPKPKFWPPDTPSKLLPNSIQVPTGEIHLTSLQGSGIKCLQLRCSPWFPTHNRQKWAISEHASSGLFRYLFPEEMLYTIRECLFLQ